MKKKLIELLQQLIEVCDKFQQNDPPDYLIDLSFSVVSLRPIHICGLTVLLYWIIFSSYVAGDL